MTTVLLLTVVMGLQAQSIVGTWETVIETDDNDKPKADVKIVSAKVIKYSK